MINPRKTVDYFVVRKQITVDIPIIDLRPGEDFTEIPDEDDTENEE